MESGVVADAVEEDVVRFLPFEPWIGRLVSDGDDGEDEDGEDEEAETDVGDGFDGALAKDFGTKVAEEIQTGEDVFVL